MKTMISLPAGVAVFAFLALAGLMGLFAFNAALPAEAQTEINYPENENRVVIAFSSRSDDGRDITSWSLAGPDAEDFSIDAGRLSFKKSPDYEKPTDRANDEDGDDSITPPADLTATPPVLGEGGGNNLYIVTVQSTDTDGNLGTAAVEVTVTNEEEAGEIRLSGRQPQVEQELTATLTDEDVVDLATLNWQWAKSSTESGTYSPIEDAENAAYTPVAGDVGQFLRVTATYEDDHGPGKSQSETSDFAVRAKPSAVNSPPAFDNEITGGTAPTANTGIENQTVVRAARKVDENTPAGRPIGKPVEAGDVDGDTLTYTLGSGDGTTTTVDGSTEDDALFDIDWDTGQLRTKGELNLEALTDRVPDSTADPVPEDEMHTLGLQTQVTITATDPSGTRGQVVVLITIGDVNEVPVITGGQATGTAKALYAEENSTVISSDRDALTTQSQAYVTDDPDAGDPTSADVLSSTVKGPDGGKFTLTAGVLTFTEAPDFEKPGDANKDNTYEITLEADGGENARKRRGTLDLKVTVMNANEDGSITFDRPTLRVGTPVKATLEDPDVVKSITGWQWYRSDGTTVDDTTDIEGETSDTYTPVAADVGTTGTPAGALTVRVTYLDRAPQDTLNVTPETKVRTVTMTTPRGVLAWSPNNEAPKFTDEDADTAGVQAERSVTENTEAISGDDAEAAATDADMTGDNVGLAVQAVDDQDADVTPANNFLIYTLEGPDADKFRVRQDNPLTTDVDEGGIIEVAKDTELDHETKDTYMVTVRAEDSFGDSGTVDVTIMITDDPNEPPTIAPVSSDATLMYLDLWRAENDEIGDLTETFDAETMSYMVNVVNSDDMVIVRAIATDAAGASVTVNGTAVDSKGTAMVALDEGANTITVMVTAEDGTTEMTYTIEVTRAGPDVVTRSEVISAIQAYQAGDAGALSRAELIALIQQYLDQQG